METYHKIQTLFKRDVDGSLTGKKGSMLPGQWTTPELEYLQGNLWEFTEKVDGTNIRVLIARDPETGETKVTFGGRTDNAVIPAPLLKRLHDIFEIAPETVHTHVLEWMIEHDLTNVALYGEGYGPKIQGGGKYVQAVIDANRRMDPLDPSRMPEHKFVLFDVKIGKFWLTRKNVDDIADKLGIDSVPVIGIGTLTDAIDIVSSGITFNDRGGVVRHGTGGLQSKWGNFEAEGIVARPVVPLFDRKGDRIITKIKAVDFK